MRIDCPKIGGALMAAAPMLMQLTGSKQAWWTGFAMLVVGPVLLGIKSK